MANIEEKRKLVDKAHRDEVRASNLMSSHYEKAKEQQEQLDSCLNYRKECHIELRQNACRGLSVIQKRECQLLIEYLDTVVETRQYKADVTQENFEKAEKEWKIKNEHYINLKQELIELEIQEKERRDNQIVGEEDDEVFNDSYEIYKYNKNEY